MSTQKSGGFTLIEVLVALIVFSLGLLGAAALAVSTVKNSNNSYLRTQASFLADNISERLRANPVGVWAGHYNGALDGTTAAPTACATTGCTMAQVAARDRGVLAQQLQQQLPNGQGNVQCVVAGTAPTRAFGISPINGTCTITVTWAERRDVDNAGYGGTQSFTLVIQP